MAGADTIKSVLRFLEDNTDQRRADLFKLLRIQSISAQPVHKQHVRDAAEWTCDRLKTAELSAEVVETAGHPCVIGFGPEVKGAPTVLVYGHYDVQPEGELSLWRSKPFEPTIRDGAVYARGAADDKGQYLCAIFAAEAWQKAGGGLPINIKFLFEGEEEIGSPNLATVVREHAKRLSCDYVLIHDTSKLSRDIPAITTSTRGLVYKEIILRGPSHDLHSGSYGGQVANPANELARIIASLHDENGRVTIPGFYDRVVELSEAERAAMAALPHDDAAFLADSGSPATYGEAGYSTVERRCIRPTLDVNGIYGGYSGPGSSTIIPSMAGAKISMRLVANQDADEIDAAFEKTIRDRCPATVKLEIKSHARCGPYMARSESAGMAASIEAVKQGYGREPVMMLSGGSLPILPMFQELLGADSLMVGYSVPDCNLHSPNEFLHISDFDAGARTTASLIGLLAG